jgi:hypothetical protein
MTIVAVTRRGRRVVSAGRRARRRVADELTAALGPADGADLLELLRRTAEGTGALEHLVRRRLRPDRDGGAPVSGGGRR